MGSATQGFGSKALALVYSVAVTLIPLAAGAQAISSEPLSPPPGANSATNYTPHLSAPQPQAAAPASTPDAVAPKPAAKPPTALATAPTKPTTPATSTASSNTGSMLGRSAPGVADGTTGKSSPSGITTPHKPAAKKLASVKPKPKPKKPVAGATLAKTKSSPAAKPKTTAPTDANS